MIFMDQNAERGIVFMTKRYSAVKIASEMNEEGLRVIAVCQKKNTTNSIDFGVNDENHMSLVGFIGFV